MSDRTTQLSHHPLSSQSTKKDAFSSRESASESMYIGQKEKEKFVPRFLLLIVYLAGAGAAASACALVFVKANVCIFQDVED